MTAAELEAGLDRVCEQDEGYPEDEDEYGGFEPFTPDELTEIREAAADELLAVEAATTGRRGPGQPGSARVFPGQSSSPAAGFGPGMPLDVLPGCAGLAVAVDAAAGEDGGFAGVSEAELVGVVCAWDRVEAHAVARKLAAVAELARRNPEPEDQEFTADQVAYALAESRGRAGDLVDLARTLQTRLPGTLAALLDGTITRYKAEIIARATALLDDAEARAAQDKVLGRAARLTPGGLRAAIAHRHPDHRVGEAQYWLLPGVLRTHRRGDRRGDRRRGRVAWPADQVHHQYAEPDEYRQGPGSERQEGQVGQAEDEAHAGGGDTGDVATRSR
jgi:hypothetical protein